MACVDVPALPLQILLRRHSDWGSLPIAIVDRDKPLGIIQCVNEHARRMRILPGMRYATALSLSRDLRAGVVADTEIAEYVGRLTRWLWRFSPRIEPSSKEPGVFWVDASGLCPLYASLQEWALEVRDNLRQAGFESVVGIGFSLFGSYAAARSSTGIIVFRDTDHEHKYLRKVPIDRLGFEPELRDKLFKLGIRTLGGFVDLPAVGIRKRFGSEAHALHEMARGSARSVDRQPRASASIDSDDARIKECGVDLAPDRSIAR
jgi:protein ImuB